MTELLTTAIETVVSGTPISAVVRLMYDDSPETLELKSPVRLDPAFLTHKEIEEYYTPGMLSDESGPHPAVEAIVHSADVIAWDAFECCVDDPTIQASFSDGSTLTGDTSSLYTDSYFTTTTGMSVSTTGEVRVTRGRRRYLDDSSDRHSELSEYKYSEEVSMLGRDLAETSTARFGEPDHYEQSPGVPTAVATGTAPMLLGDSPSLIGPKITTSKMMTTKDGKPDGGPAGALTLENLNKLSKQTGTLSKSVLTTIDDPFTSKPVSVADPGLATDRGFALIDGAMSHGLLGLSEQDEVEEYTFAADSAFSGVKRKLHRPQDSMAAELSYEEEKFGSEFGDSALIRTEGMPGVMDGGGGDYDGMPFEEIDLDKESSADVFFMEEVPVHPSGALISGGGGGTTLTGTGTGTKGGPTPGMSSSLDPGFEYAHDLARFWLPFSEDDRLYEEVEESFGSDLKVRFAVEPRLNSIVRVFEGDEFLIECDAMMIGVTEEWTPVSRLSHMIMKAAGPEYLEYVSMFRQSSKKCGFSSLLSTGDARSIPGFSMCAAQLIHCCPPFYDESKSISSQNALHGCYYKGLSICAEQGYRNLVIPPINPPYFFSDEVGIDVLCRTLRRFLEKCPESFSSVVLISPSMEHSAIFTRLLTVYFPRDHMDRMYSVQCMPHYTGDEYGSLSVKMRRNPLNGVRNPMRNLIEKQMKRGDELVIRTVLSSDYDLEPGAPGFDEPGAMVPSRRMEIRRQRMDVHRSLYGVDSYDIYGKLRKGFKAMTEFRESPDSLWERKEAAKWSWQKESEQLQTKYRRMQRVAQKTRFVDFESMYPFVYLGGSDLDGRKLVIINSDRIPYKMDQSTRATLYFIKVLHRVVAKHDYSVLFVHNISWETHCEWPLKLIHKILRILSSHFYPRLHRLFVIHPSLRAKTYCYLLSSTDFWSNKLVYIESLSELQTMKIDIERVPLPGKCWEMELDLHGEDHFKDKLAPDPILDHVLAAQFY